MRKNWLGTLALAAAVSVTATACGGDGGGSAAGTDPIKVMVLSQLEAPDFAFPEIEAMTMAVVEQVNGAGGIQGRPIELEVCNDQRDANKAGACARQAVSDGAVLVLAPFTLFGGSALPILEQAGIPYAGNTLLSPEDGTSPVSFPFYGGTPASGAGVGINLVENGCTQAGAIGYDNASSSAYISFVERGLKTGGGSIVAQARVAPGTPDYAPALATLVSGGAQCVFVSLPPAEAAKFLSAYAQSPVKPLISTGVTTMPQQVIASMPADVVEGIRLIGTGYAESDDVPAIAAMKAEATAAGVPAEQAGAGYAAEAWASAQIAFEAMKTIQGEITAESVLTALGSISKPAVGMFGQFSTQQEFGLEGFPRLFNRNVLTYTVHDGKIVLDSAEFQDVSGPLGAPAL